MYCEVERDDYVAFLGQLNKKMMDTEENISGDCLTLKVVSQMTGKPLCARTINQETSEEQYFIYNDPEPEERVSPKPVLQIKLESREEVQHFLDALNKIGSKK